MDSRVPRARSMMAADEPSDTEAKINVLTEQIEQLLKDSEEERGQFLTLLKQVGENATQIGQQAAQIQSLNSTVASQKRQLEEMQESVIRNREIRNRTIQKYKNEIFLELGFDPNSELWEDVALDGDALGDCCLYESGRRTDEEVYRGLYGYLPREVRSYEKCEFLIRALSLRATILMDHTLSRDDKGNFAALVESCHTGYALARRDKANDAFNRDKRLVELKEDVLKEFEHLQQRSSKKYDRGIQIYHWQN